MGSTMPFPRCKAGEKSMQDAWIIQEDIAPDIVPNCHIFGVFDGHGPIKGGKTVSFDRDDMRLS